MFSYAQGFVAVSVLSLSISNGRPPPRFFFASGADKQDWIAFTGASDEEGFASAVVTDAGFDFALHVSPSQWISPQIGQTSGLIRIATICANSRRLSNVIHRLQRRSVFTVTLLLRLDILATDKEALSFTPGYAHCC